MKYRTTRWRLKNISNRGAAICPGETARKQGMSMPLNEPKSAAAVKKWVEKYTQSSDRFAHIAAKYEPHREQHGCYDVYPFANGPLRRLRLLRDPNGFSKLVAVWATAGFGLPTAQAR